MQERKADIIHVESKCLVVIGVRVHPVEVVHRSMQNRRTPTNRSYHGGSLQGCRSICLLGSWLRHRRKNGPKTRCDSPSHNLKILFS